MTEYEALQLAKRLSPNYPFYNLSDVEKIARVLYDEQPSGAGAETFSDILRRRAVEAEYKVADLEIRLKWYRENYEKSLQRIEFLENSRSLRQIIEANK